MTEHESPPNPAPAPSDHSNLIVGVLFAGVAIAFVAILLGTGLISWPGNSEEDDPNRYEYLVVIRMSDIYELLEVFAIVTDEPISVAYIDEQTDASVEVIKDLRAQAKSVKRLTPPEDKRIEDEMLEDAMDRLIESMDYFEEGLKDRSRSRLRLGLDALEDTTRKLDSYYTFRDR